MTQDPHGLAAAYALSSLDADDSAAFEAHLDTCAECAEDLASFSVVLEELAEGPDAVEVPTTLAPRIAGGIAATPQVPLTGGASTPVSAASVAPVAGGATVAELAPRRRRRWGAMLAAAASVVVLAFVAAGVVLSQSGPDQALADAARIRQAADVVEAPLGLGDAVVFFSVAEGGVAVEGDMPDLPSEQTYQLWVVPADGSAPIPGPTMNGGSTDAAWLTSLDGAAAVAVSIEPQGGSLSPTEVAAAVELT